MTIRPRYAFSRQMHHFAELDAVLRELRANGATTPAHAGNGADALADRAWQEALRRRRERLAGRAAARAA
jgi:hypothetical protein